jgi:hypothetical protein
MRRLSFVFLMVLFASCGIGKYYTFEPESESIKYADSLIVLELNSSVWRDYDPEIYVWVGANHFEFNLDYIKTSSLYFEGGKKVTSQTTELEVVKKPVYTRRPTHEESVRDYSKHHIYIKPPSFENVPDTLKVINSSLMTLFHFRNHFESGKDIPASIKKVYVIDSIGYSSEGDHYHYAKTIELNRKTHRYFWLFRDD